MSSWLRSALAVAWLGCASACLYDTNNRCGPHEVFKDDLCVCESGFVLNGNACKAEPKAPVSDAGSDASASAEHGYTGQLEPCSSNADCAGFDASFCNVKDGYCIVPDCTADSCDPGWTCTDLSMFVPGLPMACTHDADQAS
ncbi:MAG: hypothetical protein QM778_18235 [Myxococcales bacterium]